LDLTSLRLLKLATPLWTLAVVVLAAMNDPGPLATDRVSVSLLSVVTTLL
jgi:hypothetical protein